jgi:large subunit ribosomal protein L22
MISEAKLKLLRMSPRKVRLVADMIRGKDIDTSIGILKYINKKASLPVSKLLKSAVSNAQQKGITQDQLYISRIFADQGPTLKRFRAAPFGRATKVLKKTTHLTIELDLIKSKG